MSLNQVYSVVISNAHKHGLTARPNPLSLLEWYRVIMNNPDAEISITEHMNNRQSLAFSLAKAEVCLRRSLETEQQFEHGHDPLFEKLAIVQDEYQTYLSAILQVSPNGEIRRGFRRFLRMLANDIEDLHSKIKKRKRLLLRYKNEALSKQSKAQKAWCDQFKRD